jgi:hypothetical protein
MAAARTQYIKLVGNDAVSVADYSDFQAQVVGTPTMAYLPQCSLDGVNFVPCNAYDKDGAVVTSISTEGIYTVDCTGWVRMAAGSGSTITLRLGA